MLGYRWLLGFSIACNVIAVTMFGYQLAAGRETEAIPFILLFAGLIGTFAGTALRGLALRIQKLEERGDS